MVPSKSVQNWLYLLFSASSSSTTRSLLPCAEMAAQTLNRLASSSPRDNRISIVSCLCRADARSQCNAQCYPDLHYY